MRIPLSVAMSFALLSPLYSQKDGKFDGSEKAKHPELGDPQAIEAGRKLFTNGCAACHGATAQGGRGPNLREKLGSSDMKDDELFLVIQKGVPGGDMPAANLPEHEAWQLIAFLRSLTAPAIETRVSGDPKAGEALFWGSAGCGNCHAIQGRGGRLGPDLTNVGGTRPLPQIRDSILDPDANPVPGYRSVTVALKDGRTLKGVARNRTNYSIQLQEADGKLDLLTMDQVREVTLNPHSAMPSGYGKRLTPEQLENVLAYLSRQSSRPIENAKK